jgi:hypothetical protein
MFNFGYNKIKLGQLMGNKMVSFRSVEVEKNFYAETDSATQEDIVKTETPTKVGKRVSNYREVP